MEAERSSFYRHTGPLVTDDKAVADIEARNALLQFDELRRMIAARLNNLQLTPEDLCALQKLTVLDIFPCAGSFRLGPIGIKGTTHRPPPHEEVPLLVEQMCAYANSVSDQPIHCSDYLMWRLNWIHPFADGNGRTSRAVSYLALCCGLGMDPPGTTTIPDMIAANKKPYYAALDEADFAWKMDELNVSAMEGLISDYLEQQLRSAVKI